MHRNWKSITGLHHIVFIHMPPYYERRGHEWHGELMVREKFVPILNEADIDLMVCGHKHKYAYVAKTAGENHFPIIISDNQSRIDLMIDDLGIQVTRVDTTQKEISQMTFK